MKQSQPPLAGLAALLQKYLLEPTMPPVNPDGWTRSQ